MTTINELLDFTIVLNNIFRKYQSPLKVVNLFFAATLYPFAKLQPTHTLLIDLSHHFCDTL